ncbi:MAG: type IV pilus modification PilV family protein [Thermodesulfobacteriota bacterium]
MAGEPVTRRASAVSDLAGPRDSCTPLGRSLRALAFLVRSGQEGFSLMEVLVASTLLAVAVIGTGYFFVSGQVRLEETGYGRGALEVARSKLEEIQGLPLQHPDLQGAPPPGLAHLDPANPVVVDDKGTPDPGDDLLGYRRWLVVDVDDPANGQGQVDYKEVQVDVAEDSLFSEGRKWATLKTLVAR